MLGMNLISPWLREGRWPFKQDMNITNAYEVGLEWLVYFIKLYVFKIYTALTVSLIEEIFSLDECKIPRQFKH